MTSSLNTYLVAYTLAPNGPEKWGCRMRIRDLFSKIRDLFSKIRDYETKKTAGAPEPLEPPSLAPMKMYFRIFCKKSPLNTYFYPSIQKEVLYISSTLQLQ